MRKYIYLIRHGECQSNVDPLFNGSEDSLTDIGLNQAIKVAEHFKSIDVEAIYHSGILRSQKTAEEIEKITNIKSEIKDFLKERKGVFSSDGEYTHTEDFIELKYRLAEAKTFLENLPSKHIIIVSHAVFLKALMAYMILDENLDQESLSKFNDTLVMDNAGISKCMFNEEKKKWRIMSWNNISHL